jgi:Ni/Co efflux regulator RcnB
MMKIVRIIAAAALAFTGVAGATTAASAAPVTLIGASAAVQDYGYDRGRYYRGHRSHRACWNEWRHGHRVTVCRRR